MSGFVVQTDEFEGPLKTLLSMIQKRELYINDISLARVTDDYIAFIAENKASLDDKAEFVRIAATLVLAKSKSLLPESTSEQDEEEIDELEDRLRAYRLIKSRAEMLQEKFGDQPLFTGQSSHDQYEEDIFAPGNTLTTQKLVESVARCVVDLPDEALAQEEIDNPVSLKEEIERLKSHCRELKQITFSRATRSTSQYHQVVSFVAILELVKTGKISVSQEQTFGTITIQANHE